MKNSITLTNSFHNTEVTIKNLKRQVPKGFEISGTTYRKIHSQLCGSKDCMCGVTFGDQKYKLYLTSANGEKKFYIEIKG